MGTRGRTGLVAALWLVTAVAAGLAGAWLLRPLPEIRYLDRPAGSPSAPTDRAPPPPAPSPGDVALASGTAASTVPVAPPSGPRPESWIEVSLAEEQDPPIVDTWVETYAVPAGSRGSEDLALLPHAGFDTDESGRIPIPIPGVYDVGLVGRNVFAFARDVAVGEGETVRLVLVRERREPATFRVEGPIPEIAGLAIGISVVPADERVFRAYPGRDDPPPGARVEGRRPDEPLRVLLSRDRDHRYSVWLSESRLVDRPGGRRVESHPSETILQPYHGIVRAGETVTLRFSAAASVRFVVRTEPPVPDRAHLEIEFSLGQGRDTRRLEFSAGAVNGREEAAFDFESTGIPGPAAVRWRPGGSTAGRPAVAFEPGGPVEVTLEPGRTIDVPIALRIDAGAALLALADNAPARIRARLPDGRPAPASEFSVFTFRGDEDPAEVDEWAHWTDAGQDGAIALTAATRREWSGLVVFGPGGLVSEPRGMPAGGEFDVPLLAGGHLVAITESIPPPRSGGIWIRRVDRRPIPLSEIDEEGIAAAGELYARVGVTPGTLLGPFPEGTHAFEVFLGRVRIGEASARVVAGRVSVLRVPTR